MNLDELKKVELDDLLNNDKLMGEPDKSIDAEIYGQAVAWSLGIYFNAGGYSKRITELIEKLTKKGLKKLRLVANMIMQEMAFDYRKGNGKWDLRKEASLEFCGMNRSLIMNNFRRLAGFDISFRDNVNNGCFTREVNMREFRENGLSWLEGFADGWINEHSTIKQNFMRSWFLNVLEKENPELASTEWRHVCFPYV